MPGNIILRKQNTVQHSCKFKIKQGEEIMAKCPFCKNEVTLKSTRRDEGSEVHKEVEGVIKKEIMYSCPHCDSILGFAFFMSGLFTGRP